MIRMIQQIAVEIEVLPSYGDLPLPAYQTEGAAGFDFYAANEEPLRLLPGERVLVPTGLKFAVPSGCELQVRPRSGLAAKHGITVLNSPGTVDSDYRGEVCVILINLSQEPFVINRGMRIAQGIFASYCKGEFAVKTSLSSTKRGEGGFGHTGA